MRDWRQRHSEDKKLYLNFNNFSKEFSKDKAMVEALNLHLHACIVCWIGMMPLQASSKIMEGHVHD